MLDFRNVVHAYNGKLSVDDVSFSVHRGEVVTLLGPSGCGKTTMLRLAAGLEEALEFVLVGAPRVLREDWSRAVGAEAAAEEERLLRAQAKTVSLEEEGRAMERRLDRARYGV